MKHQLLIYYGSFLIFFVLISLSRRWLSLEYAPFWFGGAIGAILPEVDHFIYMYLLRPHELTSQRAARMMNQGRLWDTFNLLANTRSERVNLVFHTALFQLVFYVFAFLVLTSSNSLFGQGIVLSFLLHLLIDQYLDFSKLGSISHWFKDININIDRERAVIYWAVASLALVFYGFVL